jgi:serine/threonine-protein kinase HipA
VTRELAVLMGDRLAGRLVRSNDKLRLVYDDAYRRSADPTPLSVSLPVAVSEHVDQDVAPWLAGLLPDNERVLARWSRTFQVPNTAFGLLGSPVGEDCAGAVRFVAPDRLDAALSREGAVDWLDEAGVAGLLRDLRADVTAWLGQDFRGRFSLAGAQAKTALLFEGGRWGIPSGAAATSHILKPAINGLDDHDLNGHLCLQAAHGLGLTAAATSLTVFEDQGAVVAERFDRVATGSGWLQRIHQEDLCQATGRLPALKYQNEGGPTPGELARLLRRVLAGPQAEDAVWRFFDALVFNWLVGGTDAHAKNYALLLQGGQARLAPLYDLASALPYSKVQLKKLRLAMKFGGSYLLTGRRETTWSAAATELGLPLSGVVARASSLAGRLPDALAEAAAEPALAGLGSPLPGRLVDAVAQRVTAARSTLPTAE